MFFPFTDNYYQQYKKNNRAFKNTSLPGNQYLTAGYNTNLPNLYSPAQSYPHYYASAPPLTECTENGKVEGPTLSAGLYPEYPIPTAPIQYYPSSPQPSSFLLYDTNTGAFFNHNFSSVDDKNDPKKLISID